MTSKKAVIYALDLLISVHFEQKVRKKEGFIYLVSHEGAFQLFACSENGSTVRGGW